MDMAVLDDIHAWWFGPLLSPTDRNPEKAALWFNRSDATDAHIRDTWGRSIPEAAGTDWDIDGLTRRQQVGLVILLDQFPRNIFRRSARAFSGDAKAIETARLALARSYPLAFRPTVRTFFYMPFQHSEQLADQELCCALFATLENEDYDKYAIAHRDIVARFGRFPHRNEVLGRGCTAEELEYLETADRFGQ